MVVREVTQECWAVESTLRVHPGEQDDCNFLVQYFTVDNVSCSTSAKYSFPGKSCGTRFMLIAEVALGRVSVSWFNIVVTRAMQCLCLFQSTYHKNTELVAPPDGFNSVHGVAITDSSSDLEFSDFKV